MFWIELLTIVLFAVALASILGWGFGWRHPAGGDGVAASIVFLFVILMMAMWAFGAWLPPWGPVWYGAPWLTFLLIGLFVSLLILAVATPTRRPRTPTEAAAEAREEAVAATAFGAFFWILLLGLLIAVLVSFLA